MHLWVVMYIVSGLIVSLHTFTKIVVNCLSFSVMKVQLIKWEV